MNPEHVNIKDDGEQETRRYLQVMHLPMNSLGRFIVIRLCLVNGISITLTISRKTLIAYVIVTVTVIFY
jgi:amino acid permease